MNYYETSMLKVIKPQLMLLIKQYGTNCKHYTKLESQQDDVYGVYGGITPLMKQETGNEIDIYGSPESIPATLNEDDDIVLQGFDGQDEDIDLNNYKEINNVRVFLPNSSAFRVANYTSSFYGNGDYCWCITDNEILSGDLLSYNTSNGGESLARVLYPVVMGKDVIYIMKFLLSNVGDRNV